MERKANMVTKICTYCFLIIFFVQSQCLAKNMSHDTVLELNEVNFLSVKQGSEPNDDLIIISGLAMHSLLAVGDILISFSSDAIHVKIIMVPALSGLRSDFKVPILITEGKEKIYFGNEKNVLWERN